MLKMFEKWQVSRDEVLKFYSKTDTDVRNDIDYLLEWSKKQPHLPKINEKRLESILIRNKFNLEKTKSTIEAYYTIKNLLPELWSNWDLSAPQFQTVLHSQAFVTLPKLTPNLERITISKILDPDLEKFNPQVAFKIFFMLLELRIDLGDYNVSNQMIYDLQGVQLAHLFKITPTLVQKLQFSNKGSHSRLSAIYILHSVPGLDRIIATLKPFVSTKIYNRIQFLNDHSLLHKFIPKEILPKDYGGDELSIAELWDEWRNEIENRKDWFLAITEEKSDESKRIGELNNNIFGSIPGSFRKLEID